MSERELRRAVEKIDEERKAEGLPPLHEHLEARRVELEQTMEKSDEQKRVEFEQARERMRAMQGTPQDERCVSLAQSFPR